MAIPLSALNYRMALVDGKHKLVMKDPPPASSTEPILPVIDAHRKMLHDTIRSHRLDDSGSTYSESLRSEGHVERATPLKDGAKVAAKYSGTMLMAAGQRVLKAVGERLIRHVEAVASESAVQRLPGDCGRQQMMRADPAAGRRAIRKNSKPALA